jgi:hypothetical protein
MSNICLLRDLVSKNNKQEIYTNNLLDLSVDILYNIEEFYSENLRKEYILTNFKYYWHKYLNRILKDDYLSIIIEPNINKCLCEYFISNKSKNYHYKARTVRQFSQYPLDVNKGINSYLEELLIKFNREQLDDDNNTNTLDNYYYSIILSINLKKFIIKNEQNELDMQLQQEFIKLLESEFKQRDINNVYIIYIKEKSYYENLGISDYKSEKMKLIIKINFTNLTKEEVIKYDILLKKQKTSNNYFINNKEKLIKTLFKEKLNEYLFFK